MELIGILNFALILGIIGVLIFQSMEIKDATDRMASYDKAYSFDSNRIDKNYKAMNDKMDKITHLISLTAMIDVPKPGPNGTAIK
jgi:hypothetical protein